MWDLNSNILVGYKHNNIEIKIMSSGYGTLYRRSSLNLLKLCGVISYLSYSINNISIICNKNILVDIYNTNIYNNSRLLAEHIVKYLNNGVGISYLIKVIIKRIPKLIYNSNRNKSINGLGVIIKGRGKQGTQKGKMMKSIDAYQVGSFKSGIIDIGYSNYTSTIGSVGVKVAINI